MAERDRVLEQAMFSPGTALAERDQLEADLQPMMTYALSTFLNEAYRGARSQGLSVTAAWVETEWRLAGAQLEDFLQDTGRGDLAAGVLEDWHADTTPAEVYGAVRSLLLTSSEEGWSRRTELTQLDSLLTLTSRPVQQEATSLVAAASAGSVDIPEGLMAAGLTWLARTQRTARLSATALSSAARQARIRVNGVDRKRWVTRHDDKVRSTHADVDGQTIGTEEMFIVGGTPMRYPGDRQGEFAERVNCRCVLVGVVPRGWRGRDD